MDGIPTNLRDFGLGLIRNKVLYFFLKNPQTRSIIFFRMRTHQLHAKANAEIRNAFLARVLCRKNFPLGAAIAKTAGHQDRVKLAQARSVFGVQGFGVDVFDFDPGMVDQASMAQRFIERLVAVRQVDILAHHGDADFVLGVLDLVDQGVPAFEVGRASCRERV